MLGGGIWRRLGEREGAVLELFALRAVDSTATPWTSLCELHTESKQFKARDDRIRTHSLLSRTAHLLPKDPIQPLILWSSSRLTSRLINTHHRYIEFAKFIDKCQKSRVLPWNA